MGRVRPVRGYGLRTPVAPWGRPRPTRDRPAGRDRIRGRESILMDRESDRLRRAARLVEQAADRVDTGTAEREDIDAAIAELVAAQRDIFGRRPRSGRGSGAKQRILTYLQSRLGEPVSGEELAAISGIQEWARRVRELRVEQGYDIDELGDSMYRLSTPEPDRQRAEAWRLANGIRRRKGSALARIERLLIALESKVVTREQIDYVANIKEGSRRVRELRDESGWPINSHIDEPDLRPGEYRLVSADPADRRDSRQRLYREDLRERIFRRDGYACQMCGRDRQKALDSGDTRFYLEIHHVNAVADDLDKLGPDELNDESNLITLCHTDHVSETAAFHQQRGAQRRSR